MKRAAWAFILPLAFASTTAAPQSYGGASSSDLLGYRSSSAHYRPTITKQTTAPRAPARTPTTTRAPAPQPRLGSTSFRPAPTRIFPKQFAADMPQNPHLEAYLNDLLDSYDQLLRDRRIAPHDVARAASFLVGSAYNVLNGAELSQAQFDGLLAQLREIMGRDPEFQRLGASERQRLYERYAIFGMHLRTAQSLYGRGSSNRRQLADVRAVAREQMEDVFGIPPARLNFTSNGVYTR